MTPSAELQQKLQSLAQLLEQWLDKCSPSILKFYPHLSSSKDMLERSLTTIKVQLQQGKQGVALMDNLGPLFLQWDDIPISLFSSKLLLKCWCGFPLDDFDQGKIQEKVIFSFGGKEVEGTINNIQQWNSKKTHKCIRYELFADIPKNFKSGTIQIKVQVSYGEKGSKIKDQIEKNLELGGITTEGQAVIDFLEAFTIEKQLGEKPWNYAKENKDKIEQAQTMSQLLPFQQQLQELLAAQQKMQQAYEQFAHTEVLGKFIYNRTYEITAQEYFGGYWEEALPYGSAARKKLDYLEHWKIHSDKLGKELVEELQTALTNIEDKIEAIKAERAAAEENYTTAKEQLQAQSSAGAALLDHIYTITQLDKQFEELKINYPILVGTEATDAHKLVIQPQQTIQEIQKELQAIKTAYQTASEQVEASYLEVYKSTRGKLIDKGLAEEAKELHKKAKKEKKELPLLSLSILGQKKPLPLHAFIFKSTAAFVEQANAFYALYKSEFSTLYKDVMVIDASKAELSIKAYDPLYRDITGEDETDRSTMDKTTYSHESASRLVDDKGINPEDVDQGQLGDCYFLAGVASLAAHEPEKIYGGKDSIIQGPNADGTYTVRLFIPDEEGQPKRVSIEVEPSFVTKTKTKKDAPIHEQTSSKTLFAQPGSKSEMWVQLLEKAMAQLEGSYQEIEGDKKDINYRGIQFLTGEEVAYHKLASGIDTAIAELLKLYAVNKKAPKAQFGTKEVLVQKAELEEQPTEEIEQPASGEDFILYRKHTYLYASHAYNLTDIKMKGETVEEFILFNPHNNPAIKGGTEIAITPKELGLYFDSIIITK